MFQSPRRWGGVGLLSRSQCPSKIVRWFQSPRRWGGVGLQRPIRCLGSRSIVSIPSEVGRGRAPRQSSPCMPSLSRVSIPSEVGRGRALRSFTSGPQRATFGFNPLGGGAGSGSGNGFLMRATELSVSIPSEVGRGRALRLTDATTSGVHEFQSPRRWGGVGLSVDAGACPPRVDHVSIPSEVGRGRARRSLQRLARHEFGERFSVSSRKRYKTRLAFSGTRVSWKTQETREEQVAAGRNRGPKSG